MNPTYTSVWDGQVEISTSCKFNISKKLVYDIESSDEDVSELDILTDEYVEFEDQILRAEDGVTFEY